ncbi:hypothetical protein K378_00367 [Streptomyces sp. Amel2xB2]|uniref:Uncharacterized protein n=1 Tax=Streptomyces nanshensis TaxID=518642 RepID=A0A1E7KVI1_9ACTN|nr:MULTISPECIES: hypothetical protein [Streptomyces]OEV07931.1 hypothetical protein AN218_28365 [Streptomyces nanshensis]RAJ71547.1 hypothetical protein K378_00367 [Streptomyces sp. Amel2xB2]
MSPHTSLHDDLTAAQRCLDELTRTVDRLEHTLGSGLEVRRVRSDAEHLRESLALLRASSPAAGAPGAAHPEMVTIPDKPYDHGLWSDVDDEGVGAKDRHAP